jgi:hypothetical protein
MKSAWICCTCQLEVGWTLQSPPLHQRALLFMGENVGTDTRQIGLRSHEVIIALILTQRALAPKCAVDGRGHLWIGTSDGSLSR